MMRLIFISFIFFTFGCAHNKIYRGYFSLHKIKHGDHRSTKNKQRDVYRHPVKTLKFFNVKPDMKVVEVSPGGGWYTEILGPYLKDSGELYLAIFSDESKKPYAPRLNKKIKYLTQDQSLYGKVHFTTMESPLAVGPVAPDNSVDRVLTFRNVHNWMKDKKAKAAFTSFYKALKPGGILGVVEHRTRSQIKQDPRALSGYVREDYVIDLAKSVGFEFVAKSEINANYNDNANHPRGVWTLPPRLRLKGKSKSKYQAIGESDRMTVMFKKPLE